MATIKSFTDISQSKKLAEFLPLESADMYWDYDVQKHEYYPMIMDDQFDDVCISCWSLAALLGILPVTTRLLKDGNISSICDIQYHCECPKGNIDKWFDNPIDACYELILKLNELKML